MPRRGSYSSKYPDLSNCLLESESLPNQWFILEPVESLLCHVLWRRNKLALPP